MWRLLFFISFGISQLAAAQDLTVPDDILKELKTVEVTTPEDTFLFRVAYPQNYNPEKAYKCFIGLSGGDQSLKIVNYCYAAWFRSGYFKDYLTILPVANQDTINFKDYNPEQIERLLNCIQNNFNVSPNYVIAGTSNGGIAAFNFVAAFPNRFEGIIAAPGILNQSIEPSEKWSHLKVVLAYGELDDEVWIKGAKTTASRLKKSVKSVQIIKLAEQGHILPIKFNVDKMYDPYFLVGK